MFYVPPDLQQQPVCQKEEVPNEQQLCNSSLDQQDPDPPQIEQEQEELCSSQEQEQLAVNQETETVMLPPIDEEHDKREDQSLEFCPGEEETVVDIRGGDREDSRDAEAKEIEQTQESKWRTSNVQNSSTSTPHCSTDTGATFKCDTCGEDFKHDSEFKAHLMSHTGQKPYVCKTCGTAFTSSSTLSRHVTTVHAGEKFLCKLCGLTFKHSNSWTAHMRTHTGERPYPCSGCGKKFNQLAILNNHLRTHTGEKPFSCSICGASFSQSATLKRHFRIHR